MKKPTIKEIEAFLKAEFPHIEFDGIKFEDCKPGNCWFKIISFGRMIGQANYPLNDDYWRKVKLHLKWVLG